MTANLVLSLLNIPDYTGAPCTEDDVDPSLFDTDGHRSDDGSLVAHVTNVIRQYCDRCPLVDLCLDSAIAEGAVSVIRGGHHFSARGKPDGAAPQTSRRLCAVCDDPTGAANRKYCPPPKTCRQDAQEIHHGTEAGAAAHRRRGSTPCATCLGAETRAHDTREQRRENAA